jgi:hypothetical protein
VSSKDADTDFHGAARRVTKMVRASTWSKKLVRRDVTSETMQCGSDGDGREQCGGRWDTARGETTMIGETHRWRHWRGEVWWVMDERRQGGEAVVRERILRWCRCRRSRAGRRSSIPLLIAESRKGGGKDCVATRVPRGGEGREGGCFSFFREGRGGRTRECGGRTWICLAKSTTKFLSPLHTF